MRQWRLSHPGNNKVSAVKQCCTHTMLRVTQSSNQSRTDLNFSYDTTCAQHEGNAEFWKFYFQSEPSGDGRHFKYISEDVNEYIGRWVNTIIRTEMVLYPLAGDELKVADQDDETRERGTSPWQSHAGLFLSGWVATIGSHCFPNRSVARAACARTAGCAGINLQADECEGRGWTLRGGSLPSHNDLPACSADTASCACELLKRRSAGSIPTADSPLTECVWFAWLFLVKSVRHSIPADTRLVRNMKDIFSVILLLMVLWYCLILCCFHRVLRPRFFSRAANDSSARGLGIATHIGLFLLAALYTDWMSGLLHVVLDNALLNTWPIIGPEARAFQSHHFDPTGVARGPILDMVRGTTVRYGQTGAHGCTHESMSIGMHRDIVHTGTGQLVDVSVFSVSACACTYIALRDHVRQIREDHALVLLVMLTFAVGRPTSQVFFAWQPCTAVAFSSSLTQMLPSRAF
jgi:hypothetical protein